MHTHSHTHTYIRTHRKKKFQLIEPPPCVQSLWLVCLQFDSTHQLKHFIPMLASIYIIHWGGEGGGINLRCVAP